MEHNIYQIIWFILWGVLWAVYFMLDGFDLGLGTLMPFVTKTDLERRLVYNAMGPVWDGNEVWLITAGGATFAAFPKTYAVMFSGFYSALLLILFALIVRGVSFEFRNKEDSPLWRATWDFCLFIGSFIPALLFGVAFANIFKGIPIDQNGVFHGNIFTLLNPYGLLGGIMFVTMFLVHGALWLAAKTEGDLSRRAGEIARKIWAAEFLAVVAFFVTSGFVTDLWLNYLKAPILLIVPFLALLGLLLIMAFAAKASWWKAWFASCLTVLSSVAFGIIGLFPRLLPSNIDPAATLTIYNSSSSLLTLKVMTVVALIFVPLVIAYQTWAYKLFSFKITPAIIASEEEAY